MCPGFSEGLHAKAAINDTHSDLHLHVDHLWLHLLYFPERSETEVWTRWQTARTGPGADSARRTSSLTSCGKGWAPSVCGRRPGQTLPLRATHQGRWKRYGNRVQVAMPLGSRSSASGTRTRQWFLGWRILPRAASLTWSTQRLRSCGDSPASGWHSSVPELQRRQRLRRCRL